MKVPQVDLGYFTVPVEYQSFTKEEKEKICDKIIDSIYKYIDRNLEPDINRISFLEEIFESSLITNEEDENYEMCMVLKDCLTRLNED
jgi:hypothetical protein